jgi:glucosylceramidase
MIKIKQTAFGAKAPWKAIHPLKNTKPSDVTLMVHPDHLFQSMIGFGAAFTEAVCHTLTQAPSPIRRRVIKMYFSNSGLRYQLGRTTINSCDFSLDSYTYVQEGDTDLSTFSLAHDDETIVPIIKLAQKKTHHHLALLASPWSPPAYMKSNQSMKMGGKLLARSHALWAQYIVRYLQEMTRRGLPVDYLTIQNEPEAIQTWESCGYTGFEEGSFISQDLLPALRSARLEHLKILIWDHNRDRIVTRAQETFYDENIRQSVWGIAYHWYVSDEHENLSKVHELYPEKHLLFTEGCVEYGNQEVTRKDLMKIWRHGEMYGRHMINDFNNHTEGWIDWNFLLNESGGPNHARNYCEAPLMYDRGKKKLIVNPSYYFIGHFSKFVTSGARRLGIELSDRSDLYAVSFLNQDGTIVTIIQNEGMTRTLAYSCAGRRVSINIPSHSITTLIDAYKPRRK